VIAGIGGGEGTGALFELGLRGGVFGLDEASVWMTSAAQDRSMNEGQVRCVSWRLTSCFNALNMRKRRWRHLLVRSGTL